ncbi:glycoside hydrolase family 6 protein [Nocardioides bigeumensis]|uniref:Glucanase n=1 Tax=Nocardioides bigeumensis TaxID=433657 RepID=A0ABN2Y8E1_9ACTN
MYRPLRAFVAAAAVLTALTPLTSAVATPTRDAPTPNAPTPNAAASTAAASTAQAADELNPLAGRPWGVYQGRLDQAWQPWASATGTDKALLGRIALTPKGKWFGGWIPNAQIGRKVRDYVKSAQAGNPEALVQMTVFRVNPWEERACSRLPTRAEKRSYRDWTNRFAAAIGTAHTAIVLQPDGPFALCTPGGSTIPSKLIAYSARVLSALPNTSVYIDVGAADWPHPTKGGVDAVLKFLLPAGIQYARGIALNSTHYSSTTNEVARGAAVVQALETLGMPGKKVVINTSSNGKPFDFGTYDGVDAENARVCSSPLDPRICVTLGIPPTTDVANPAWGLSPETNALATAYVDAYLWFGRPWLYKQADPFVRTRALGLVTSWPYAGVPVSYAG